MRSKTAPDTVTNKGEFMSIEVTGLLGLIVLVLDIWAIVKTLDSRNTTGTKVFWVLLILLLPVLGFILWLIFSSKTA